MTNINWKISIGLGILWTFCSLLKLTTQEFYDSLLCFIIAISQFEIAIYQKG